jgi:micrococcal nuclease
MPLDRFLRWQRTRRIVLALLIPLLLVSLSYADRHGAFLYSGNDVDRYNGKTFPVDHVIDGDTLVIRDGDLKVSVRFLGINAPEIAKPWLNDKPSQPFGDEAAALVHHLADGKSVRLVVEPGRTRERFGRLLAFLYLEDGTCLNETVLAAGLARDDPRWTHEFLDRYDAIEKRAQAERLGLWHKMRIPSSRTGEE